MGISGRVPPGVEPAEIEHGFLFWAGAEDEGWEGVRDELAAAFRGSRDAAIAGESIVYVVSNDALLGRLGAAPAMVAAGLLSAARTAALEGARKGWTANVVAYDREADPASVMSQALRLLDGTEVTGELVHVGAGHIGKALP